MNPSLATSSLAMRSTKIVSIFSLCDRPNLTPPYPRGRPRRQYSAAFPLSGNDDADQFLAYVVSIALAFRFGPDLE